MLPNSRVKSPLASGQCCGVERAFSLLSLDHAQVIYAEDGSFRVFDGSSWFEHCGKHSSHGAYTVNQKVVVPSVLLRSYDRMLMQEIKFNRQNLWIEMISMSILREKSSSQETKYGSCYTTRPWRSHFLGKCRYFLYPLQ